MAEEPLLTLSLNPKNVKDNEDVLEVAIQPGGVILKIAHMIPAESKESLPNLAKTSSKLLPAVAWWNMEVVVVIKEPLHIGWNVTKAVVKSGTLEWKIHLPSKSGRPGGLCESSRRCRRALHIYSCRSRSCNMYKKADAT